MIITKKIAREIAEEASELKTFSVLDSTGYYLIYSNNTRNVDCAVDISKVMVGDDKYYGIYVSYEGLDHNGNVIDSYYTQTDGFDKDELTEIIFELANRTKELYGNRR